MGEKLLAQQLFQLLRETSGPSSQTGLALLDWVIDQRDWLWPEIRFVEPDSRRRGEKLSWTTLPAPAERIRTDEAAPAPLATVEAACDLLGFDPFERAVLRAVVAVDRLPRLSLLRARLFGSGLDLQALIGRLGAHWRCGLRCGAISWLSSIDGRKRGSTLRCEACS